MQLGEKKGKVNPPQPGPLEKSRLPNVRQWAKGPVDLLPFSCHMMLTTNQNGGGKKKSLMGSKRKGIWHHYRKQFYNNAVWGRLFLLIDTMNTIWGVGPLLSVSVSTCSRQEWWRWCCRYYSPPRSRELWDKKNETFADDFKSKMALKMYGEDFCFLGCRCRHFKGQSVLCLAKIRAI